MLPKQEWSDEALDTLRFVATPEGCELALRIAGPMVRARAWLIDFVIRIVVWAVCLVPFSLLGDLGGGLLLLLFFLLEWFYPVLFEVYRHGATPGKQFSNLHVLHDDGTPVGWQASFARNTLRFVDFLPLGYTFGLFAMWLNKDCKRLGDILAGTVVVYRSESAPPAIRDDFVEDEPPPFPLTLAEQRALIEYRYRADMLTDERADELASLASPLTQGLHSEASRKRKLFRIANGLLGRRG